MPMWNVNERFPAAILETLPSKGFQVGSTRGVVRVEKYGGGAEFRQMADGRFQMTIMPSVLLEGQFTRLWDAGYLKFLHTAQGCNLPALHKHPLHIRVVTFAQVGSRIDIDFAQSNTKFVEQRRDLQFWIVT